VIAAHGCYAMTATTALTAQNTEGVLGIHQVPPEFTRKQIDAVFADIRPSVVKTGESELSLRGDGVLSSNAYHISFLSTISPYSYYQVARLMLM
jgi:hypothetical protein